MHHLLISSCRYAQHPAESRLLSLPSPSLVEAGHTPEEKQAVMYNRLLKQQMVIEETAM
jgi:hypothetical protein